MGVRPFVCSSIAVLVLAGVATRAHAQGVLQNTYDRGSWPTQYEQRTIVLPEQMWQLELDASVTAVNIPVPDASQTDVMLSPSIAYGINRNFTIGAAQFSTLSASSGTDPLGNPISNTSTVFGRGDVFAIARPFNDYDVGFRVDVPFIPNDPTIVQVGVHFIGHVSITLERLALFFDTGVRFKAFADDTVNLSTDYAGGADVVFQVNPQLALTGGGYLDIQTFGTDAMGISPDNQTHFDLRGAVYYNLGNGIDIFGRAGIVFGDFGGPYLLTGIVVFR
jgi:hypothetical protein